MSLKTWKFALAALLLTASSAVAAPLVTMVESTLVRSQVQGAGTYKVLDFFYTASDGAEFTNYTLDVTSNGGSFLRDPARLQDDRQINPDAAGDDTNTTGAVDTWANTVMSAAGKIDGGYAASISANPAFYQPTGSGVAPAFQRLQWDVFDTEAEDDNDLNDHSVYPVDATAPYHLARVLADTAATGIAVFAAFDSQSGGTPSNFQFNWGAPPTVPPNINGPNDGEGNTTHPQMDGSADANPMPIMHQFTLAPGATEPINWSVMTQSYTENYNGVGPGPHLQPSIDQNGKLSWNPIGSPRGDYVFKATASNVAGMDMATLTVQIKAVPEPSTLALCGLAMVGLVGLFRRR